MSSRDLWNTAREPRYECCVQILNIFKLINVFLCLVDERYSFDNSYLQEVLETLNLFKEGM